MIASKLAHHPAPKARMNQFQTDLDNRSSPLDSQVRDLAQKVGKARHHARHRRWIEGGIAHLSPLADATVLDVRDHQYL